MSSSIIDLVYDNLIHANSWKSASKHLDLLSGYPNTKLAQDDEDDLQEWIVPRLMSCGTITTSEIDEIFTRIDKDFGKSPRRLTMALINDDSTISYYFIHKGIVKPRKN